MVEHYRPRPMNSRRSYRDEELMHYGIKGMKKGVRKKDVWRPGEGPLKPTKETRLMYTKKGIINDTESYYTFGKSPYGSKLITTERRKVKSQFRKDLGNLGRKFVSHIKARLKNYSASFKNQAKRMERNVRNFLAGSSGQRKRLTR